MAPGLPDEIMNDVYYYIGCFALLLLLLGFLGQKRKGTDSHHLSRARVKSAKRHWPLLLVAFAAISVPWTVFFLLWGGVGGLGFSGVLFCSLFASRGYMWVGHGPGGSEEAMRRNVHADEHEEWMREAFGLPALMWVLISIVLILT